MGVKRWDDEGSCCYATLRQPFWDRRVDLGAGRGQGSKLGLLWLDHGLRKRSAAHDLHMLCACGPNLYNRFCCFQSSHSEIPWKI